MKRIFIDDPVKRLSEGCQAETELPPDSGSILIHQAGSEEDQLLVIPKAANQIVIT